MAIIIPSKHIYGDRQNAKVRDNVIERIEVNAKEVVPDNEYEVPVHNEKLIGGWETNKIVDKTAQGQYNAGGVLNVYQRCVSYLSLKPIYAQLNLVINKLKGKSYIEKIYTTYKGKETKLPQIGCTVRAIKQSGTATALAHYDFIQDDNGTGAKLLETPTLTKSGSDETVNNIEEPLLSYEYEGNLSLSKANAELDYTLTEGIIGDIIETENTFEFEFKVLVGYEQIKMGWYEQTASYPSNEKDVRLNGTYVNYIPQQAEITVYGNTIGIDLTDKTVYINGELQKKVHSIDGNELMQTGNYVALDTPIMRELDTSEYSLTWIYPQDPTVGQQEIGYIIKIKNKDLLGKDIIVCCDENLGGGGCLEYKKTNGNIKEVLFKESDGAYITDIAIYEKITKLPAIETRFADTQAQYARGKETATIRCSISDYYDSDNGFLKVSTKGRQNLVKFPYVKRNATAGGVTFTLQEDGGIHLQGTPTANEYITFSPNIDLEEGQTYTFSLYGTKNENIYFETILSDKGSDTNKEWVFATGDKTITKTIPNGKGVSYWAISLATPLIGVYLDEVVYPMVNKGTTALPYQPYNINMSFQEGDIVIPMVYGVDGQDRPMSTYQDGTAKQFMVLGAKKFFDGAVWQELYLQEIAQPIDN